MRKRRRHVSRAGSKRLFKATATKVHKSNLVRPMRGGERM